MKSLIVLTLFLSINLHAKSIIIGSSQLSKSETTSRVHAVNGVSYSDYVLDKLKSHVTAKNLFQKAADLRQAELNKNYDKVFEICDQIQKIRHDADWAKSERYLISRCLQHLANLSTDARKKTSLVKDSHAFTNQNLDKIKLPKEIVDNYRWILINGKSAVTKYRYADFPQSTFRMTLVSDRHQAITKIIHRDELNKLNLKPRPLVTGDCQNGYRYESRHLDSISIENALVVDRNCKMKLTSNHPIQNTVSLNKESQFKFPNWALWVAGGIVGYTLYENSRDKGGSSAPTSKRGF